MVCTFSSILHWFESVSKGMKTDQMGISNLEKADFLLFLLMIVYLIVDLV